jgi:hypothetical protein
MRAIGSRKAKTLYKLSSDWGIASVGHKGHTGRNCYRLRSRGHDAGARYATKKGRYDAAIGLAAIMLEGESE